MEITKRSYHFVGEYFSSTEQVRPYPEATGMECIPTHIYSPCGFVIYAESLVEAEKRLKPLVVDMIRQHGDVRNLHLRPKPGSPRGPLCVKQGTNSVYHLPLPEETEE